MSDMDDRITAAVDLIGRTGARSLEVGYLHEDVPPEEADWYATALFAGTKVIVEHKKGPGHALDSLLVRLLDGGKCTHCGKPVTNSKYKAKGRCLFVRKGDVYVSSCSE